MGKNRGNRLRLFGESPYCKKCGEETFLFASENGNLHDNCATVQHNLPKTHSNYRRDITLWCNKCNQEDAIYKQVNKVFSREELLHYLLGGKNSLNGNYVIDYVLYRYHEHKLVREYDIFDYKFERLKEYMKHSIDDTFYQKYQNRRNPTFQEFLNLKGTFSFKKYYIGDGWYHYIPPNETEEFKTKIQSRMDEIMSNNPWMNKKVSKRR